MSGFSNSGRVNRIVAGAGILIDNSDPSQPVINPNMGPGCFEVALSAPVYVRDAGSGSPTPNQNAPIVWNKVTRDEPGFSLVGGLIHVDNSLRNRRATLSVQLTSAGTPLPMNYSNEAGKYFPVNELSTRGRVTVAGTIPGGSSRILASGVNGSGQQSPTFVSGEFLLRGGERIETLWRVPLPPTGPDHGLGGNLSFLRITIY